MKTYDLSSDKISGYIYDFDALKQSIAHYLEVAVGEKVIFTWDYGNDLLNILDQPIDILIANAKSAISNALLVDDRIIDVYDFSFERDCECLIITFTIDTIYGTTESEVTL